MPVNIPQSVFDKYFDVIDSTFDIFGVTCQLVSIEKKEEIVYNPNNNIIPKNSVNVHRIPGSDYDRGTKTIREIETLTDIKLKVYWEPKQFVNVGNIQIPEGVIQTICFMKDLPKIIKAKALIVHKDIKDYKELRFERMGEFTPMGLQQDRYFACMWKRV